MNELQVFSNNEFGQVRTVTINNEPWFVARDVSDALGYSNHRDAIKKHVDIEDKGVANRDTLGGKQDLLVISESGLYSLILRSKLPSAKQFKRWVTSEVLPTIHKHGAYMTDSKIEEALTSPDFIIKLATELKKEKEARELAQQKIEADQPKVIFAESVTASKTSILVRDLAKILNQNGIKTGEKRLFEWLRENGYLIKQKGSDYNSPTQRSMDMGLFEVNETAITRTDGVEVHKTSKVTGKGQVYFVHKFLSA